MVECCENKLERQSIMRQSNIELLRIIAIVIIIASHFSTHGNFEFSNDVITINRLWIQFIQLGGNIGVNVFVLISGYFLVTAKCLKTSKVIKLWIQIFTYSVVILIVFVVLGIKPLEVKELIKHCFPVIFSQWWFASTYFVLYLLSPFINTLLNSFTKRDYQRFLVLLTVCWCIIPTVTGQPFESNSICWFIYIYAIAGYIKMHASQTKIKGITYILLSEYSCAMKSHFRKSGNQMSGKWKSSYASLLA